MSDIFNFENSEFFLTPKAVIVHEPTEFNVFDRWKNLPIQEIRENFLFREIPDNKQFYFAHHNFVDSLKKELKLFYVADIINLESEAISERFSHYFSINPNLIYTRDAIITLPWIPDGYIVGRMVKKIRQL